MRARRAPERAGALATPLAGATLLVVAPAGARPARFRSLAVPHASRPFLHPARVRLTRVRTAGVRFVERAERCVRSRRRLVGRPAALQLHPGCASRPRRTCRPGSARALPSLGAARGSDEAVL